MAEWLGFMNKHLYYVKFLERKALSKVESCAQHVLRGIISFDQCNDFSNGGCSFDQCMIGLLLYRVKVILDMSN